MEFIKQEYLACLVLVVLVFVAVWQLSEQGIPTAVAFLVGALTSMICGAFGMLIATQANNRTAYCVRFGLAPAFRTAYKASAAIGFGLTSLGLLGKKSITQLLPCWSTSTRTTTS